MKHKYSMLSVLNFIVNLSNPLKLRKSQKETKFDITRNNCFNKNKHIDLFKQFQWLQTMNRTNYYKLLLIVTQLI